MTRKNGVKKPAATTRKPVQKPKYPVSSRLTAAIEEAGKKFDSEKPRYVIVPAVVRQALTPAGHICAESAIRYRHISQAEMRDASEALDMCLRMSIHCWYEQAYVDALIWICRYFLIVDGHHYMDIGYPLAGLDRAIAIMEHGALKYGLNNWQAMADWDRYESAGDRHLGQYLAGQKLDKDSGLEHLAHWQCNVLFKAWKQLMT